MPVEPVVEPVVESAVEPVVEPVVQSVGPVIKPEYEEEFYMDRNDGINNNEVGTLGLLGAVAGNGYGGYGRGRGNTDVGHKILYDQNHENYQAVLEGNCEQKVSEMGIKESIAAASVAANSAGALREVQAQMNANARHADTNDRFREVAAVTANDRVTDLMSQVSQFGIVNDKFATQASTDASNRMHDTMNNTAQHADMNGQFAVTETKLDLLCNKVNEIEKNTMSREIDTLNTASILAGQRSTMLEAQLKDFCCPKPSIKMETVGCGTPCATPQQGMTIADVMAIVSTMLASSNGHGGHGRGN